MKSLLWILAVLSVVAFILAVTASLTHWWPLGVTPEGYSRACNNLALIAIVVAVLGRWAHEKQ